MKKFIINKNIYKLLGIVLFIILWQVISMIIDEDIFILPGPYTTLIAAIKMASDTYIYKCLYQTLIRMIGGFVISFVLAFILGVIAGNDNRIEELIKPTMTIFRSIPTATLVYLFLVVIGAKLTPMFIVILVSFPILYESVLGGIKSTPREILEAANMDTSSLLSINYYIRIPLAFPYIIVGIASSFALSLKIEIMAEVITGFTRLGLGSAILAAQRSDPTNMVPVFAYSMFAIVLMLLFDILANKIKDKIGVV